MHLATKTRPKTLHEAWLRAIGFRLPVLESMERLFEEWTRFRDVFLVDATRLSAVGRKYLGIDLRFSEPPVLGSDVAGLTYKEAMDVVQKAMQDVLFQARQEFGRCEVGTIAYSEDGESCRFNFHEVYRRKGLFRDLVSRTPHEHELVRARVRRVDDKDVKLPPVAQGIVNDLTAGLRRELRVVVGTEIIRQVGDEEVRKELTPLGRALVGVGKTAAVTAPIAAGVATAGLLRKPIVGTGLLASAVFLADPALVLGDICLYGWEDE